MDFFINAEKEGFTRRLRSLPWVALNPRSLEFIDVRCEFSAENF